MSDYAIVGNIIDGTGREVIANGLIIVRDARISEVGSKETIEIPPGATVIDAGSGTILPGFIDSHTHLCAIGLDVQKTYTTSNYELILQAARDCSTLVDAGFTGVREMGEFGPYLKRSIEAGITRGPRITPSGRILTQTAGHIDMDHTLEIEFAKRANPVGYIVDGIDECIKGARYQFREGAEFIKICTTGGVMSKGDTITSSQLRPEEIRAIVDEAESQGTYVATHGSGTTGILNALKNGVKSIEHGTFMDEECIDLMAKEGCYLVPTITILKQLLGHPENVPPYAIEKGKLAVESHAKSLAMAIEADILIALGTDLLGDSVVSPFGTNGMEFVNLVEAGLSPMEAIVAGTKNGSILMRMEDEIGTIEAGKYADVVIADGDPLEDITILAEPDKIRFVMKGGTIEKQL